MTWKTLSILLSLVALTGGHATSMGEDIAVDNNLEGSARQSSRSVVSYFHNNSDHKVTRAAYEVVTGEWLETPPAKIPSHEWGAFASVSCGFMTGTSGWVTYRCADCNEEVGITWNNPYAGGNTYIVNHNQVKHKIVRSGESGDNAVVRFFWNDLSVNTISSAIGIENDKEKEAFFPKCTGERVKDSEGKETNMSIGFYYRIKKKGDGRVLDGFSKPSAGLDQRDDDTPGHTNRLWTFMKEEENYYRIKKKGDGRVLDGFSKPSAGLDQRDDDTLCHTNRLWTFVKGDGDYYRIKKKGDGRVLDGFSKPSAGLDQRDDDTPGHTNRLWEFVPEGEKN